MLQKKSDTDVTDSVVIADTNIISKTDSYIQGVSTGEAIINEYPNIDKQNFARGVEDVLQASEEDEIKDSSVVETISE